MGHFGRVQYFPEAFGQLKKTHQTIKICLRIEKYDGRTRGTNEHQVKGFDKPGVTARISLLSGRVYS